MFKITSFILIKMSIFLYILTIHTPLHATQSHQGGSLTKSPWVGVSFMIPKGFKGNYDQEAGAYILKNDQLTFAIYGASEGDVETMGELVVEAIRELGINMTPKQVTRPNANTLDATFSAYVDFQPRDIVGTVRKGSYGSVISIIGMGATGKEQNIRSTIKQIVSTLKWSQPQGANQRHKLVGKALYRSGGSSDGRSGPGGFTGYSNTKTQIDFCSNGQYGYQSVSESSISVGGAYGSHSASNKSAHQGRWWFITNLGGEYYLYLESNQGKYYLWPIYETNNGANIDGANYSVSQSSLCF